MAQRVVKSSWYRVRWAILLRDDFTCRYCGQFAPNVMLHVDHIRPVTEGGTDDHSNLITACTACNQGKEGFRAHHALRGAAPTRPAPRRDTIKARLREILATAQGDPDIRQLAQNFNTSDEVIRVTLWRLRRDETLR